MPKRSVVIAGSRRYTFDMDESPEFIKARLGVAIEKAWVEEQGIDRIWLTDKKRSQELQAALGIPVATYTCIENE